MDIKVDYREGWRIVRVSGRVDSFNYQYLTKEIYELVNQGDLKIVVNLEEVKFLSMPSMKFLTNTSDLLRVKGGELALLGAQVPVKRHLEVFADLKKIKVADTFEEIKRGQYLSPKFSMDI